MGERLRYVRELRGLTQKQLSESTEKLGVEPIKQSTISKIERGSQEKTSDAPMLSYVLEINSLWLSHGIGPMTSDSNTDNLISTEEEEDVMLYQYDDPRCVHGPNAGNSNKPTLEAVSVSLSTLNKQNIDPDNAFAFIHSDESMMVVFSPGDHSVIDVRQTSPVNFSSKVFCIAVNGALIVRRVFAKTTGGFTLSCDNSDKSRFPDEVIGAEDAKNIAFLGRLVWGSGAK